ncbi:MAG: rhodanese-like domain-containing protein [Melioribacteraceae bacterium]|nr:rhodanese-like domain-containing protein [Melioribacteraceae bacterium]MCF8353318.1 rhodanese-like domain-containing protein [Melioribacteraceae bacterium]MCF8393182.1 rhodanese-like domain-containing protein [Melioribacteraceae bacterium]MCF8419044.1 rhodanese-like domain-containing protein [Melioribacteraceae bacterium]
MKNLFEKLSGSQKLAAAAILLGLFAAFAGDPFDNTYTKINTKEIALDAMNNSDKVDVRELAEWLIEAKADFRLIDLRTEEKFNEYFIPSAANIQPAELMNANLMRNEKIVLYADENTTAAQAWFLLKSKDYKAVYILEGGLDMWKDKVLFPKLASDADAEEKMEFAKFSEVSKFFGGMPQTGLEEIDKAEQKLPELKLPASTTLDIPKKKKKREGC